MSWIERTVEYFREAKLSSLDVDEAFLNVTSHQIKPVWLYSLSDECYNCPFVQIQKIKRKSHELLKVDSIYDQKLRIYEEDKGKYTFEETGKICEVSASFGEFGVYDFNVDESGNCQLDVANHPVNIYLPLLVFCLIILALIAILTTAQTLRKKYCSNRPVPTEDIDNPDNELDKPKPKRIRMKSLDTFRGMAIVLMIFCNSGAGHYSFLEHCTWNGIHIPDFIFPCFLWIMGVCIPMSVKSQLNRNVAKSSMLKNVLRRSITLFLIGVCLNSINGPNLENLRLFGVLQRFGVAYLVVGSLQIIFAKQPGVLPQNKFQRYMFDIWLLIPQWLVMFVIVAIYLAISFLMPVPGCPKGYLGPGGMHEMGKYNHCIGGATGYIDRMVLGENHIYKYPTANTVYHSGAFDPEGVFGCLMTVFQVFLGVQCGMILLVHVDKTKIIKRWLVWGVLCGLLGGLLCNFSKETGVIPINKNMWSLSFVLVTTGFAFLLLTACYYIIDVKRVWSGFPFMQCGMNAILMYVGHTVFHKMLPWHWKIGPMNTHFVLLLESGWNTLFWPQQATNSYINLEFYGDTTMASVNLDVDEAYLNVTTNYPSSIYLYYLTEDCYECPFESLAEIRPRLQFGEKHTFFVSTKFHNVWRFYRKNMGKYVVPEQRRNLICEMEPDIGEFGVYDFFVNFNGNCDVNVAREPVNSNLALLYFFLVVVGVVLLIKGCCFMKRKFHNEDTFIVNDKEGKNNRLLSIDTFRGILVLLMIFVNSGGGSYWWLAHAEWNGATIPDFIFPGFLWIMGFCIPLSISSKIAKDEPKSKIFLCVLKRSLILFLVGICESSIGEINLDQIQIRGIIQRFALAYLVLASLYLMICTQKHKRFLSALSVSSITPSSNLSNVSHDSTDTYHHNVQLKKKPNKIYRFFYDLFLLWKLWIFAIILITIHCFVMFYLPVPGCPTGYMGPGGSKHLMGKYSECTGGSIGYIDKYVLGNDSKSTNLKINNGLTAIYETVPLHPYSLFGNILTIVQVFFGLQCGVIYLYFKKPKSRLCRWIFWAIASCLLGGGLCQFKINGGWIPLNQNLWTMSFVLVSTSVSIIIFVICFTLIDHLKCWKGRPFIYPGMNSILLFVGHQAIGEMLPFHWKLSYMNSHFILLLENGWTTFVWFCISYFLYKKDIFLIA